MERNTRKLGMVSLLALLAAGVASYAVARHSNAISGAMTVVFMALGTLVSAVSWFQMRLEERERLEKLEFEELARSASGSALFNSGETEVLPARRSREQFERYFVPGFAAAMCLLELAAAIMLWRSVVRIIPMPLTDPLVSLGMFCMFFLLLFLLGRYATGLARMDNLRLLRPGATYLLLCAYLCLLVLVGVGFAWTGFTKVDRYIAGGMIILLGLVGVETLITLILELYRPRVKGKVGRPLYESRLVSLLGQPEGLLTTAAHTLDYQFGFKVSETWGYQWFARWLPLIVAGQVVVLLLSTTVVFIDAGQQAILERSGRFVEVLKPGAHFKLPWPVDRVFRFDAERIQTTDVGFTPESEAAEGNVVLWTVAHTKEDNFLVASRTQSTETLTGSNNATSARVPPVNLLTVSIPVHFQITNLVHWFYNNEAPQGLLNNVATREVIHYLVNADMQEVMSSGRAGAAETLRERIQAAADQRGLGAKILLVGLQDIHPPVKVAADYEKVISAYQTTNANYRNALAAALQTNSYALIESNRLIFEAKSDQQRRETNAAAQVELFSNQVPAYLASPSVYMERTYLDTFSSAIANARVFVVLATNAHYVAILNLEDKIGRDLTDIPILGPPPAVTNSTAKP